MSVVISVFLVVKIIVESDTLYEGQIVDTIRSNSRINIWTDISGTALEGNYVNPFPISVYHKFE